MGRQKTKWKIVERNGSGDVEDHAVIRVESYNEGFVLVYGSRERPEFCYMKRGYRALHEDGFSLVAKNKGNVSAASWVGQSTDPEAPGDDLSLLARTHLMASGYRTLYEQKIPWKWMAIGVVVLVAVVAVFLFVRSQGG